MSEADDELERRIEAAKGRIELQEALVVGLLKHGHPTNLAELILYRMRGTLARLQSQQSGSFDTDGHESAACQSTTS
jgi:hypothetical protein